MTDAYTRTMDGVHRACVVAAGLCIGAINGLTVVMTRASPFLVTLGTMQLTYGIALAITSGALAGLHAVVAQPHHLVELAVLVVANLVATAVRFVLLRGWVFHPGRSR